MRPILLTAAAALVAAIGVASPAAACGPDTDCVIDVGGAERIYRIHLPEGRAPDGAILFHHGYRGSAAGAMRNSELRALAERLGVAVVAAKSDGDDWQIPNMPSQSRREGSDALAYTDALLADLEARHAILPERILATGFSAGGMMTWHLACQRGGVFAGFAPVAGTFWRPVPQVCPSPPANLVHIHGRSDRIVPMEGRPIADTHQGDLGRAVAMYAQRGGFRRPEPQRRGALDCLVSENADGIVFDLCMHDGGHEFRAGYVEMAWRRIMER